MSKKVKNKNFKKQHTDKGKYKGGNKKFLVLEALFFGAIFIFMGIINKFGYFTTQDQGYYLQPFLLFMEKASPYISYLCFIPIGIILILNMFLWLISKARANINLHRFILITTGIFIAGGRIIYPLTHTKHYGNGCNFIEDILYYILTVLLIARGLSE